MATYPERGRIVQKFEVTRLMSLYGGFVASKVKNFGLSQKTSSSLGKRATRRNFVALLLGAGFLALAGGCLSPTLPLPPPSSPYVTAPNDNGLIELTGRVPSRSPVYVHNTRTDDVVGQFTEQDGRYQLTIAARRGDFLTLWYSEGTRNSGLTDIVVPERDPLPENVIPSVNPGGASGSE